MALIKVQNKIQQTIARLPQVVQTMGVRAGATSSGFIGILALTSPTQTKSELFLTNYANSNVINRFKRIPGMGDISIMGTVYSIRIWLDPEKMPAMEISVSDVQGAIQSQNLQAALGSVGASPSAGPQTPIVYSMIAKGRRGNHHQAQRRR